jgi:hypothetical protein
MIHHNKTKQEMSSSIYQHRLRRSVSPAQRQRRTTRSDSIHSYNGRMRSRQGSNLPPRSAPALATWNDVSIQSGYVEQSSLPTTDNFSTPNSPCSTIRNEAFHPLFSVGSECPICFEKLISSTNQDIGATVPCGHCFHWDCYQKWKDYQERKGGSNISCPTCRECSTGFMRIYITPETKKPVDKEVIDLLDDFIGEHESLIQEMIELKKHIAELEKVYSDVKEIENNNLTLETTHTVSLQSKGAFNKKFNSDIESTYYNQVEDRDSQMSTYLNDSYSRFLEDCRE